MGPPIQIMGHVLCRVRERRPQDCSPKGSGAVSVKRACPAPHTVPVRFPEAREGVGRNSHEGLGILRQCP